MDADFERLTLRSQRSESNPSPRHEGQKTPADVKQFLRMLRKDTTRLTYQNYRQLKHSQISPTPNKIAEAPVWTDKGPFLPLLPIPVQGVANDKLSHLVPEETALPASEQRVCEGDRSPKLIKVYHKAKGLPWLRDADLHTASCPAAPLDSRELSVGDDGHAISEAESCQSNRPITTSGEASSRKRRQREQPTAGEDGSLTPQRGPKRAKKRPKRLLASGLALVKTISSPTVSADDPEVRSKLTDSTSIMSPQDFVCRTFY